MIKENLSIFNSDVNFYFVSLIFVRQCQFVEFALLQGDLINDQSAPTDGRDPSKNVDGQSIFLTSKQNSDANGLKYQWGRKDPFSFATSSQQWGEYYDRGKYPVKIYTIDGVLIYQESNGSSNKDKQPVGGIIHSSILATSMMETIHNPITFYGDDGAVVDQVGQTRDLWNYYWTSYSRGTDGAGSDQINSTTLHNIYLDKYQNLRSKSIYDPCPYGFKVASNGTWNLFKVSLSWVVSSYTGGHSFRVNSLDSWFITGRRYFGLIAYTGYFGYYYSATINNVVSVYGFTFSVTDSWINRNNHNQLHGHSVRCIEGLCSSVRPNRRTRPVYKLGKQTSFLYQ